MSKKNKLKAELILEVVQLQERVVELETADTEQKLTLEMFQKSEEKYRALYENSPLSYQSLDEDGCLIDVNPAWLRTLGYERDQVIGKWFGDFLHPDWKPHFEISFSAFKKHGYVHGVQFKMKHQDGHYLDILFEGRISYDPDGKFKQTYCVFEDITERVQVEQKYKDLVEKAGIAVLIDDREGNFVYFNETFIELFGYSEQEIQQKNIRDLVHPEDLDQVLDQHNKRLERHPDQQRYEFRGQRKDGTFIQLEVDAVLLEENNTIIGTRSYLWDITERVRAEEALRDSESSLAESNQLLSGVLEHTHMMAVFLDAQFNFIWVNSAYADTCRNEPSFFPGKNHFDLYPHEENQAIFQNVVDTGEPFFVEAKPFEFPDQPERGVTYWNWSLIPIKDDKKAVTGLVFTLAEVTERVQAEKELEDIFNLSPDMVGVFTTEGILLKVNPAWEQILGYTQKELLDLGWAELVHPDDVEETNKVVEKQLKGGSVVNFVNRYKCKGGSYKTLEWQATYAKGGIVHATARDITERKKAEEALRESESRWRSLAESSPDHILTLAPDLTIQYANFASPGLTIDDIVGKPIYAFVEEEKQEEIKTILMGVLNSKQSALYETEYPAPDGGIIYYETHAIARKTGGDVIGLTLSSRDITERKQAEMELRESEEKYQKLFDGLPYGGEVIDTQGYIIDCSESNAIVYGYERDELIGKHITEFLAPEAKEIYRELFPKILNGEPGQAEIQMIHKDGSLVNIIRSARPLFNQQGSVVSVLAINTDITERKKAEAELHSVAQQWQNTFDAVTDAICILDTEQRIIRTNQAMNEMFPEQKGKMVGKHCFEVVHGLQELIENCPVLRMRHTLQRESLELELGERILEVTADPILDDSGALTGIVHSLCNITNRVQMEQELTTATNIINRSPAVVFLWKNKEGWPVEFVSTNVNNLIGYSAQALMEGKVSYNEIIHSDDLNRVTKEVVTASTKKDQTSFAHEPYRIITKHGDMKWVGDRTLIRRDSRGAITHYEGVVYDITEHKLADEALSLRSEELAALLRVSQALNASLELATVLQETTNSATDLMGIDSAAIYLFEGEELYLGATTPPLDSQMPEDFRRAAIADHPHIHKTVTTGHPVILDDTGTGELTDAERAISDERGLRTIIYIPILSGQKKWGILILGTIGKTRTFSEEEINLCMTLTNQVALSIQNAKLHEEVIRHSRELEGQITERKQAEKEKDILLDQVQMANERLKTLNRERINLQEEERKRISQELHDELGQALTAITLDLGIIERELDPETDRDIRKRLSETRTIANELDQKIDELAFDLRPSILDDLGLIPTLKWYADRYSQRAEVEVEIEVIGRKKRLPPEIETALYRITQEALTNVAKHAQAKKIKLQLDRQPKTVTVSIEDDGQGFDVEELQTTLAPPQSMGLAGMKDRISLLGGRLEIHSKPGEGTRIEIEIPL